MRIARSLMALLLFSLGLAALARPLPSNTVYLGTTTRADGVPDALATHRLRMRAQAQGFERFRQELIRRRGLSARSVAPHLDSFVVSATTRAVAPAPTRAYGEGALTFAFQGWTAEEESVLRTFLSRAYTELKDQFIGAPASSGTLLIVKGGLDSGIEGGEFNPDTMTLTLEPVPADFTDTDGTFYGMNLVHLLVHAFHAPALLGFDAWEEGIARATAAVAMMNLRPGFELDLIYDTTYLLPLYDLLNQPALANATFFPSSGIPQLVYWRVGMAYAAWLKVYAENPTALKAFHAAYYAQYSANPAIAGNLGSLKSLMAAAVPSVEGAAFTDWYQRQHVLQPVSIIGKKIYVFPVPLHDNVMLHVYYYLTNAGGTETPLGGTAKLEYTTFDYFTLDPLEGDEIVISSSGSTPGVGFLNPSFYNIGETDTQRIRISTTIDALRNVTYFPAYTRGDDLVDNPNTAEFYGAIIGANDGTVRISLPGMGQLTTPVVQGAISQQLSSGDITFLAPVVFEHISTGGKVTRFSRNVGPGSYTPILVVDEQTGVLSRTLPAGFSMISFPITPTVTDAAALLGSDVQLAWWDSAARLYRYAPNSAIPPIAPGYGYWVKVPTLRTVQVAGTQPTLDDPRAIVLRPGWNMIGNTFNGTLNPWSMTVEMGNVGYRLEDAVKNGVVSPVWTYDSRDGYVIRGTLGSWEGGWMYNPGVTSVTLRQLGANRSARTAASDDLSPMLFEGGWGVALDVRTATANERLHLGVTSRASNGVDGRDWMKPPAMASRLQAAFVHPGRAIAGAAFATDVRQSVGINGESWEFVVSTPSTETVTLCWPDLRRLPRGYSLLLEDVATGKRQYLQSTAAYTYQATGTATAPDTRVFKVTATNGMEPPVRILQMLVQPTRGGGASINISLSGSADVLLDVRTPTGKLVRSLRVPASRAYDSVVIPWDGRASGGKLIPSGTYLLTLTAHTAEGYTIRRADTVTVGRR